MDTGTIDVRASVSSLTESHIIRSTRVSFLIRIDFCVKQTTKSQTKIKVYLEQQQQQQ